MKKSLLSIFLITLTFISCKQNANKEDANEKAAAEKTYVINVDETTITWTAYKTTDKVPVKGTFSTFTIDSQSNSATVKEALNGLKFSIPVSSLHTNDSIRDGKLKNFFFGSLKNTAQITGTIHLETDTTGYTEINMNGISHSLLITYTINDQTANIEGVMDLDNWQAQAAIEALNIACKELHTGPDGVSKTWNEVKIEVVANFKSE
jgi:hypothetical protein